MTLAFEMAIKISNTKKKLKKYMYYENSYINVNKITSNIVYTMFPLNIS